MIRTEVTIDIDRPPDEVFDFIANFENNPRWQNGMREARFTSEPPLRLGSTYDQVATFLGREIVSSFEVIAHEPGRMVQATSTAGSFPITFTRRVAPHDGGSRVTAVIEGDARGFFRLAEPLLAPLVRRSIRGDYTRLKRCLESPTSPA